MVKRPACDIAVLTLEGPMTAPIEDFRRPSRLTWRAEWPRSTAGLGQFWATFPLLVAGPRGDGHEVLAAVPLRSIRRHPVTTKGLA